MKSQSLAFAAMIGVMTLTLFAAQPPQHQSIGVNPGFRDLKVKPGDDFEEYANGAWRKSTEIPADRSSTGVNFEVFQKAEKRTAELVQQAGASKPAQGTSKRLIADYYAAYMDTAGIEKRGLDPLKEKLARIARIKTRTDLAQALGEDLRADVDPLNATNFETENLFGLFAAQALTDPSHTVPYLLQGGLGMPDRDYYLSDKPQMVKNRSAYQTYVTNLLKLAGQKEPSACAERILAFETKIARAHLDRTESEDIHKANNPRSPTQLSADAPGLDWDVYLAAAGLDKQPTFILWQLEAIKGLSALVASEPIDMWKEWMTFHLLNQSAPFLPKAFDNLHFGFYGTTLEGTQKQRDRWKRGIAQTNAHLGDAIGRIYVEKYFPAASKAALQEMVKNLLAAFEKRVDALEWMAPETKAQAKAKIKTLRVGVGYPETWRDYKDLVIRANDPAGNASRAIEWEYRYQLRKLGKPVDHDEWWMTPQTVNAVNLPLQNGLNFPAAILEPPYFDPKADAAANYGAIGAVIGHEISHSFDNTGAEFNSLGKLENWWTPEDQVHFKEASKKLVDQYSAYEPLPGLKVNGELTLGENIADVAGLAAAYDAYRMALHETELPVVDGLNGDQRFFLAFAQAWRRKVREQALRQQIVVDGHAPARERAQTVRNLDPWYGAYEVKSGERLYLAPGDRVRIW